MTSLLIYSGLYIVLPLLPVEGMEFLPAYQVVFYFPFVLVFMLTFYLTRRDGIIMEPDVIAERLRLKTVTRGDADLVLGVSG